MSQIKLDMFRNFESFLRVIILSSLLMFGCTPNADEDRFINKISETLKSPGDIARVSDIYPLDWDIVCAAAFYTHVSKLAADVLKVPTNKIKMTGQTDTSASDTTWMIVFIRKPDEVKYFTITANLFPFRGGDCVSRNGAAFKLTKPVLRNEIPGLEIINLDKAKEND